MNIPYNLIKLIDTLIKVKTLIKVSMLPNRFPQNKQRLYIMCTKCQNLGFFMSHEPINITTVFDPKVTNGQIRISRTYCFCEAGKRLQLEEQYLRGNYDPIR